MGYYKVDVYNESGNKLLWQGAEFYMETTETTRRGVLKPFLKAANEGTVSLKVDGLHFCKFNGKTSAVTQLRPQR